MEDSISLTAADYAVFGVMLAVSAGVGVFFAYKDRNSEKAVENYLLGNRTIPWAASGFSASLSFVSAVTVLGIPAEIMYFGPTYAWFFFGTCFASVVSCEVTMPIIYKNELSSTYQYFERRFNGLTRLTATIIYIIQTVLYVGVMMFAPALVLNAVTNFSLWGGILSVGLICILYTTLGGLKAVIWTDVIQGITLIVVLTIVLFMSAEDAGGFDNVWKICSEGDRLDFFHFELDPRYRMTIWGAVVGIGTMWTSIGSTNQAVVQRFLCCNSVSSGKKAIYLSVLVGGVQVAGIFVCGFITYAYFGDCDPLANRQVSAADQVFPYMVLRVFRDLPGMSGLFVAGLFAAALSTISSAMNGMSCVTLEDIIRPNVKWSERTLLWVSKGLTVSYGLLGILFAYIASLLGGLIQASLSLLGLCAGALFGPVEMGMLCPFTNSYGAVSGMITALAVNTWIYIGSLIYPPPPEFMRFKDITISGCPQSNVTQNSTMPMLTYTFTNDATTEAGPEGRPAIAELYAVSFAYYSLIGLFVCVIIGLPVSLATGGWKTRHDVNPKLIYLPFEHPVLRWLPEKFRRLVRPTFNQPTTNGQSIPNIKSDKDEPEQKVKYEDFEKPPKYFEKDNLAYIWDDETISTAL